MSETLTAEARLAEAEAARHALLTGSQVEQVTLSDGRTVRYSKANLTDLDTYIGDLRRDLGMEPMRRRRAIGVRF